MALLAIFENDVEISARSGSLVLLRRGTVFQTIAAHEIDEVHLHGGADLTTAGRNFLLARGIDVVFLTMDGRVRGRLVGDESAWADRRISQYKVVSDDAQRLVIAKAIIAGKVQNQLSLVTARQAYLKRDELASAILILRGQRDRVGRAPDLDQLRGCEGFCANVYFGVFGELITNAAFTWNGRNRRPPRDPVNAALSYGYTMLCSRVEHAVRKAGLDPYLGVLHEAGRGAPTLALDLAEEFRPVVDALVLNQVNRRQLGPEDFGPPDPETLAENDPLAETSDSGGAIYLSDVGRKVLTRAWALRLQERSPHPVEGRDWTLSGLIGEQAQQIRRVFEDPTLTYRPVRL